MQKFGLQTNKAIKNTAIELEVVREQASALGRAGKKLRLSLEEYEAKRHTIRDDRQERVLIKEISENVWALMLQREFLGFIDGNLSWVCDNYVIPQAAIESLGKIDQG